MSAISRRTRSPRSRQPGSRQPGSRQPGLGKPGSRQSGSAHARNRTPAARAARAVRTLVVIGGLPAAIRLARRDPRSRVHVFEPDWDAVDRARQRVRSIGLEDRVHVWHHAARDLAMRFVDGANTAA